MYLCTLTVEKKLDAEEKRAKKKNYKKNLKRKIQSPLPLPKIEKNKKKDLDLGKEITLSVLPICFSSFSFLYTRRSLVDRVIFLFYVGVDKIICLLI